MTEASEPTPEQLRAVLAGQAAAQRSDLEALVRIPSVSADPAAAGHVRASADAVAALLAGLGLDVEVLTARSPDGVLGAPAVIARRPAPPGAPTVMLYAHHDVQPPGTEAGWTSPAFEPVEREGRLYGRGSADDKAGVMVHVGALRAVLPLWGPDGGTGVTVFVEGEEEVGSPTFAALLAEHRELLAADVVVIADSDNWAVDTPSLTTSLRGLVGASVTVRTLDHAVHSGLYGGPVLDATTAMVRLLDRLFDEDGTVAVPGLRRAPTGEVEVPEDALRAGAGVLEGVGLIGRGGIAERLWTAPALTVVGLDTPSPQDASNTLQATATAKLSLRVAPGQEPVEAYEALRAHLVASAPWGAHVEVELLETGQPFAAQTTGPVHGPVVDAAREALSQAWGGVGVVHAGIGGSIPFIADLVGALPGATVLVTGVEDPDTRAHGHDESLHLAVLERATLAEALLLTRLGASTWPGGEQLHPPGR